MFTNRRRTWYGVLWLLGALLLAAAACGESGEDGSVSPSCDAFDGFDSYRYSISVKMQLPSLQTSADATPGPALGAFADSLAALLSDFKIDGAYVAPDRRQAVLDFQGDQVELREVGEQRWERFGETWEPLAADSPDIDDLSPELVCTDLVEAVAPSLAPAGAEAEDVNGVSAQRYSIDRTNVDRIGDILGVGDGTELPEQFAVDVWFASDGDWPVRLEVRSQTADPAGAVGAVEFVMELRDVNDSAITIDDPAASDS